MAGTLYLCATPIGNLEDITFRVLDTLRSVDLIAAEDTRNSIKLLNHFEIKTPMTSYHEFNKFDKGAQLIEQLLAGKNIAVITDAGMPGISDPGEELVKMAYEAGVTVTVLPSAVMPVTPVRREPYRSEVLARFRVAFTSSAVRGEPSENTTFVFRKNV